MSVKIFLHDIRSFEDPSFGDSADQLRGTGCWYDRMSCRELHIIEQDFRGLRSRWET